MELNLERLNNISFIGVQPAQEKQPARTPTEPQKPQEEYKTSTEQENALKEQLEGLEALQRRTEQEEAEHTRLVRIFHTYQDNIRKSGQLQTELLKGVQAGEDIYNLFLKAVKAISCMTDNESFYNQIKGSVTSVYGIGLHDPAPLLLEIRETQERLHRLREAERLETDTASKNRINRAIKEHEKRIEQLTNQIPEAERKPA